MPKLWERFIQRLGIFANYFAAFILSFSGALIVLYLIVNRKSFYNFFWLIILALIYIWGLNSLKLPIEKMHFVEYGLLSVLLFRALRYNMRGKSIYLNSGIAVFCLGLLDEGIQYILPNRVYEVKDVIINTIAGMLGLFVIGLCFQPKLDKLRTTSFIKEYYPKNTQVKQRAI
jgi:uncharacterized membrane protein YccC